MFSYGLANCIIVPTSKWGTIIVSEHSNLLHGNLATLIGNRVIANFYLSSSIVRNTWASSV